MHISFVRHAKIQIAAFSLLLFALGSALSAPAQTPGVVFSYANGLSEVPDVNGSKDSYQGTANKVAANSRGDVFSYINSNPGFGNCTSGYVLEVPVNSGNVTNLITDLSCPNYDSPSVYVDSANNVYVDASQNAQILYVPFRNGGYPASVSHNNLVNCSAFPVPVSQTTTCIVPLNYPASLGYYIQAADIGMDGAGNLYALEKYCGNGCLYPNNSVLLRFNIDGSTTLLNTTLSNDGSGKIAVDKAGDVLLKDNGVVTLFPATNYISGSKVNNLQNPQGVSVDSGGNFYINDAINYSSANNFYEIPATTALTNVNTNFLVSNQAGSYFASTAANSSFGIDGFGAFYYGTNQGYPNSLSYLVAGKLSFGTQTVGGGAGGPKSLNLVFNTSVAAITFNILGPAGAFALQSTTCSGGYTPGNNCTITLTYAATALGAQNATLQALNGTTVLGTATLSGLGVAPELNVDPGNVVTDGTGYKAPSAVAVDASGNIFVTDSSTGTIYKTSTGSTTAATAVVAGFTAPTAVAVDGSGNLYVADSGSVYKVPNNGATYGAKVALTSGLSTTTGSTVGLALDAADDLYVADSGNGRVLRLSYNDSLPQGSIVVNFGSGYTTPVAVAVDNTGNFVYVVDSGSKSVVQIGVYSLTQATVVNGLKSPTGIAADAAGSIYVVDNGAATVTRVPNVGGAINNNQASKLATIVKLPNAIAIDAAGSLYVTDTTNQAVATDTRTAGTINFGYVNETQTSSTVSAQLSNGGNATTTFNTPYYTQTGTPAGATTSFAIQSSSTCASGQSINQGASCLLAASFSPLTTGQLTDTLNFSSNANAASLKLTGYGTNLAQTTTTLAVTSPAPPAQPTFGQSVTVQATVAPASGTGTPGGTVTFYLDNVVQGSSTLANGTASYTFTGLLGGKHTINASYSGDIINYASSNTNANPLIITVGTATSATSVAISATPPLYTNPTSAAPNQSVTLTAIVTPGAPGTPTGTVFFFNGTTQLNSTGAVVVPITSNNITTYQASYTTSTLPLGQYSITAQYSGDSNYSGSSSSPGVSLLISNPTIQMTSNSSAISGGGSVVLTISSIAGFNGAVDLACTGLPAYSTCSFSPAVAVVTPTVPAIVNMQVVINQAPAIAPGNAALLTVFSGRLGFLLTLPLLLLSALLARRRKFGHTMLSLLLLLGVAASVVGCGNGTSASYNTPKGTYKIVVTGTVNLAPPSSPVVAATVPLTLTVN